MKICKNNNNTENLSKKNKILDNSQLINFIKLIIFIYAKPDFIKFIINTI